MSTSFVEYTLGHPDFGYYIVSNSIFHPQDIIAKSHYNKEMPYLLLPVLKSSLPNSKEMILNLDDAIDKLNMENANQLSFKYQHAIIKLRKIYRSPSLFFGFFNQGKEFKKFLKQTKKNIDSLLLDPKSGKPDNILFFAIQNHIPVEDKIIFPKSYVYPEIDENPWYVNYRLDDGEIMVSEVTPVLKGFLFENENNKECHYFPKYEMQTLDNNYELTLHRKNGKVVEDGVLDSYSTTRVLYKNKEAMLKALSVEKEKLFNRIDIINQEMEKTGE
jgi:hypothetical protein